MRLQILEQLDQDGPVTFVDWEEPTRLLEAELLPITEKQQALASFVGLELAEDTPRGVAAALLEEAVQPHITGVTTTPRGSGSEPTDRQLSFLREIAHGHLWARAPLTKRTASAWIGHFLSERTARRLRELKLTRGDNVLKHHRWVEESSGEIHEWSSEHEVSSIGTDGLVYFRGGNGQCAWPTSLTRQ